MRQEMMYELDQDDPPELSIERLVELRTLFDNHIPESEKGDGKSPAHPAVKAMNKIKGHMPFTRDDVLAVGSYVDVLLARKRNEIDKVMRERDTLPGADRRQYDSLIGMLEDVIVRGRKIRDEFVEAFETARLDPPAPSP